MKIRLGKLLKPVRRMLMCKSVRHVAAVCAVFALVIGGGVYAVHNIAGIGQLFGPSSPSAPPPELVSRSDNVTGSTSMKDDDPVKNFARTGVGHVLFTGSGTDACKRTLFDNKTGAYKIVDDISCGTGGDQAVDDKKSEQLNSMRKAFSGSSKK